MITVSTTYQIGEVIRLKCDLRKEDFLIKNWVINGFKIEGTGEPVYQCLNEHGTYSFFRAHTMIRYNGEVNYLKSTRTKPQTHSVLINNRYSLGDVVYYLTDNDREPFIVSGVIYKGDGAEIDYALSSHDKNHTAKEIELTDNAYASKDANSERCREY